MTESTKHTLLTYFIALVWIANGLLCKVMNLVPRHKEIVRQILNLDEQSASTFTIAIGFAEILMAAWILSGIWNRVNAVAQILVIGTMNTLEFFFAPELLLWGKANALFALMFIVLIYYHGFGLNKKMKQA